jgi:CotH kinase protein
VINQSPFGQTPPGWAPNGVNGQAMNYGIDPDIINLYGAQAVKDSLQSLSTISITTDLANLFDPSTGIYVNATLDGRDWERPASVELINPDGTPGFTANAGLRIRGGYSRGDFNPKHAFRFYFRNEYGDGRLHYPLFGDEGTDEFDVIDLRTAQNYAWSTEGNAQNTFLREVFGRDLQRDLNEPYTRSRYYHLYIDGVYWGLFQTQERVEEFYSETYFGGDQDDYDIVKHGLADVGGTQVSAGNDAAWFQLFTLAESLSGNPTANANAYWTMQGLNPDGTRNPSLPVLLDVDNLIDYMLILFYTGGYDSGLSQFLQNNKANNWYGMYNRVAADEGFQFFIHDNEHSLGAHSSHHGTQFIDRTGPFIHSNQSVFAQFNPGYLHQDLLAHPEYRYRIVEKAHEYFFNGGPMTPEASIARMTERMAEVGPAIIAESARWGDAKSPTPRTKTDWQNEVNWLLNTYFPGRTNTVVTQLRADGLYVSPPTITPASGSAAIGAPIFISPPEGQSVTIYYTTDGVTDPRLPGGGLNPSAAVKVVSGAIVLTGDTVVMARFRTGNQWSPLIEAHLSAVTPGDFDADGDIDGRDFLRWQRELGSATRPFGTGADGNSNGRVDSGDLAAWRANFGNPSSASSQAAFSIETTRASLLDAAYSQLVASSHVFAESNKARPTAIAVAEEQAHYLALVPAPRRTEGRPLAATKATDVEAQTGPLGLLDDGLHEDAVDQAFEWDDAATREVNARL